MSTFNSDFFKRKKCLQKYWVPQFAISELHYTGPWKREKDPVTGKEKKTCETDQRFRRVVYEPVPAENDAHFYVIIHYIGDESIATQRHHGNRKAPTPAGVAPYLRTASETLGELCSSTRKPILEYSDGVERSNNAAVQPRDPKQVANCQRRGRDAARISKDALWSAIWFSHEMAERGKPEFIRSLSLRPALLAVLMDHNMIQECRAILRACDSMGTLIVTRNYINC